MCRHRFLLFLPILALSLSLPILARADEPERAAGWPAVEQAARGQTVYWNAWGGSTLTNDYIAWVGDQVAKRYGVTLKQVKLSDTAEAVSRVVAEKAAGNTDAGVVDLIWINGENFAAMKQAGLLYGPWSEQLPNYQLVDPAHNPAVSTDFTVPVDGLESPWGKAQIVFYRDTAEVPEPPRSMTALLDWTKANPGRFTYPLPPDFLGSTFLKQVVLSLVDDPAPLYQPVPDDVTFARVTAPLWRYLDELHPNLWRQGRAFPANGSVLQQLVGDGEVFIGFTFQPGAPAAAIKNGELPETVRSFVPDEGTIGNVHFVAIPFNASHKAGAMVVANFLLSPEAQARKQDPAYWGDFTVLAVDKLPATQRQLFEAIDLGAATLRPDQLGKVLPEPHPSWMERIEAAWLSRYGA